MRVSTKCGGVLKGTGRTPLGPPVPRSDMPRRTCTQRIRRFQYPHLNTFVLNSDPDVDDPILLTSGALAKPFTERVPVQCRGGLIRDPIEQLEKALCGR
jgi:hypothetical protein